MANSVDPDQTAPIGAVCSGSTMFASILNWSETLGNYLQQTTSADDIFRGGLSINSKETYSTCDFQGGSAPVPPMDPPCTG